MFSLSGCGTSTWSMLAFQALFSLSGSGTSTWSLLASRLCFLSQGVGPRPSRCWLPGFVFSLMEWDLDLVVAGFQALFSLSGSGTSILSLLASRLCFLSQGVGPRPGRCWLSRLCFLSQGVGPRPSRCWPWPCFLSQGVGPRPSRGWLSGFVFSLRVWALDLVVAGF